MYLEDLLIFSSRLILGDDWCDNHVEFLHHDKLVSLDTARRLELDRYESLGRCK